MRSKKPRYQVYSWKKFDSDVKKIGQLVRAKKTKFDGVWGPARGGLPLAVCLSHELDLPFLPRPKRETLIVDDIADSGKTLKPYAERNSFIATIFYHRRSSVTPNIWLREKKDKWIIFPWENKSKTRR